MFLRYFLIGLGTIICSVFSMLPNSLFNKRWQDKVLNQYHLKTLRRVFTQGQCRVGTLHLKYFIGFCRFPNVFFSKLVVNLKTNLSHIFWENQVSLGLTPCFFA